MAMTSYEIVRRALEFETPDRLPLCFSEFGLNDTHKVAPNQIFPWENQNTSHNLDEWGCLWERSEMDNMGQVKGHPLSDWSALNHYHWPDPDDPLLFVGMDKKFEGSENKYVLTSVWFTLFERMHLLHGFENTLSDLILAREKIEMLADRILEYDMRVIENISNLFPNTIHGIYFSDDWGSEQGPIINPKLWREFFKPRYKRMFDQVHNIGWHIWFHSCGKINAFLEDFIELGVNAGNFEQPRTLGIEEIGAKFSGRICFSGPCDIQNTLPLKNDQAIEEEAQLLISRWGTPEGGFIAQDKAGGEAYGSTVEKRLTMFKAFQKYDRWKKQI